MFVCCAQAYRQTRSIISPCKDSERMMSDEAVLVLHEVYIYLLRMLAKLKPYADQQLHGVSKLHVYFAVMSYCLVSRTEKLMFTRYFIDLWNLFQPKLSEPAISQHVNKQVGLAKNIVEYI